MIKKKSLASPGNRRQRGFTLIEVLVSTVVFVQIILVALLIFDFNRRVTRVQTRVSDMQQSLRVGQDEIVRTTRMAGRSGIPVTRPIGAVGAETFPPFRLAVSVANNVTGAARQIAPTDGDTPTALAGTDILTVRGNFSTPHYHMTLLNLDDTQENAKEGTVTIARTSASHPEQDLTDLANANTDGGIPEAMILIPSTPGESYVVVELEPASAGNTADLITMNFVIKTDGGMELADQYRALWTNDDTAPFPMAPGTAGYLAILEEYRFYVRNDGDPVAESARTRLSRARLLPGTGAPWSVPGVAVDPLVLSTDISDNILDLQVSLGFDTTFGTGTIGDTGLGEITETLDGDEDDWLFNNTADDIDHVAFTAPNADGVPPLYYVRITTLARTGGPDTKHQEPVLTSLEDRNYAVDDALVNSEEARMFRRRFLKTTIDLRNL
ncbi:MAG: prepilin-type N-terminal cleavage/methylation domain-containing protein [Deltaproteobacteria bacterium]|nr:prepilin-type N-terminal cleavage/methylation domain-containing protein [Deltaproteobacteria bacterium]